MASKEQPETLVVKVVTNGAGNDAAAVSPTDVRKLNSSSGKSLSFKSSDAAKKPPPLNTSPHPSSASNSRRASVLSNSRSNLGAVPINDAAFALDDEGDEFTTTSSILPARVRVRVVRAIDSTPAQALFLVLLFLALFLTDCIAMLSAPVGGCTRRMQLTHR
jgi:hypothetical protein